MALQSVDLNCDLGEAFGFWRISEATDEELMDLISSANVATGFHAGDPNLMDKVVKGAVERGVAIGAHPGFRDLQGFGRRVIQANPDELVNDIVYQVGALREFARRHGTKLQHVKPHGALYMEAATNAELSERLVDALLKCSPDTALFCMHVSETYRIAKAAGIAVVREFYADRDYSDSGSIVFTRRMRALNPQEVADKCVRACLEGKVRTVEGNDIDIPFESICFHSDTPGAHEIGKAVRAGLVENGIRILPAGELLARAA
ncbi:5-oxoprolinase subunit PxpA [Marivibrio halodurans]|uniref:5-oxoprolinase subunit PxpA n=1 Tax=Marivibrio halodurans TaxID=2039722 RepID=A0A8J7S484_9PROT|nr:5-oxoprolinase subunit PxpA [Marivibrio halodurans]